MAPLRTSRGVKSVLFCYLRLRFRNLTACNATHIHKYTYTHTSHYSQPAIGGAFTARHPCAQKDSRPLHHQGLGAIEGEKNKGRPWFDERWRLRRTLCGVSSRRRRIAAQDTGRCRAISPVPMCHCLPQRSHPALLEGGVPTYKACSRTGPSAGWAGYIFESASPDPSS